MTRVEFERKVAEDSNSSYRSAREWTQTVLDSLADAIITEKNLDLYGFGSFEHIPRKAKVGRNASTGERIDIPAHMGVKFRPGKKIREAVAEEVVPEDTKD